MTLFALSGYSCLKAVGRTLIKLTQVTNEDVAFLEPPVVLDSSISETTKIEIKTNSEPSPQRQQQISNPEKAQRKIKRLLNKLEPYNIPNEIINDSGDGNLNFFSFIRPNLCLESLKKLLL